ncbi:MAG: type I polyketide synthase, partial [Kiloniellaceae bacterium]
MEPIAIIGMGCRFPGADNPDRFWQLLAEAGDAIREVPAERWDLDRFFDPDPERPGRMNTRWGGFLDGVDRFDPEFFGISSREAAHMDPQQRLALEVAWEAVEDAGLARHHLAGTATGVFIGVSNFDYSRLGGHDTESIGIHSGIGTALSIVANRVSYLLDLRGPSVVVDTACSSSLVAVHLACQSLQNGESQMALAGGVNLMLGPEPMIAFSKARMMADDGRCKAFDDRANGYVRGEGAGIVVLKPLPAAHADRDPIVAVIRGGAMNQDGFTNGLTAPNPAAQKAVIRQACRSAGIAPGQLDYVEAHGTGTHLGDPIEAKALGEVLANGRPSGDRCAIGSVKTNIGHLESAAGIAGLIKVALALKNRQIPASLHFARPNRYIPFDTLPLRVQEKLAPWPEHAGPALAGVSSFGFGGTNVHVILEAPPPRPPAAQRVDRPHHILTLSAKGKTPLRALAQRYDACLARHPELDPGDLCFTANARRSHFRHHVALTGENLARLRDGLAAFVAGTPAPGLHHGVAPQRRPTVAFLFTGQGAQYPDMGRSLYQTQPVFKRVMDRCDEVLRRHLDRPLLSVLYDDAKSQDQLDRTGYTQPALFALECGLAELWRSWGIKPDIVLGHSIGEYAAACVAGAFSLEEGLVLVAERARLMQALPAAGMMAAAFVDESRVREVLADSTESVALAALNGPRNTVISGERAAVERALERLRAARVRARALPVSHAFHSPLVEPMLDAFEAAVGRTTIRPLRLPLVSNLNGEVLQPGSVLDARYWRRHTREPVRFAAGIAGLLDLGHRLFLELGPRPALSGIGRQCRGDASATWLASLRPGMEDWRSLLDSLAALYVRGARVDWDGFDQDYARRRLHLPTYPFDRRRCWMGAEDTTMTQSTPQANTPEPSERAPVPQARREIIVSLLRSLAGDILWTDSATVDPKTPFVELGADSVVLIELVTKIESALGVQLPVRRFYEDLTTIDALADFLERSLPPEWEAGHSPRPDRDPARGASRPGTRPEAAPGALEAPGVVDPPMKSAEDRAPISSTGRERDATERLFQRQLDLLSRVMARQLEVLEQAAA